VARIDLARARPFVPPDIRMNAGQNTTHFVVADKQGNIVSATQTLGNILFASKIMPKGTGIWLNDSLAFCTFDPKGNPMDAHAGRRKLSGDCPTIVRRGTKPWMTLGTSGGHAIGQTVPQMLMNMIDFGMNIQEALAAPRVSFVEPNCLQVESSIPESFRAELREMGHQIEVTRSIGIAHGLTIQYASNGYPLCFLGGADPRGEGKVEAVQVIQGVH
jgi:gamma-glutamyltranspeptidase / glutathione hydrolase